jgi:hypothetical protein
MVGTAPPALYFGIHLIEGEAFTPMLLARRFTLNPVIFPGVLVLDGERLEQSSRYRCWQS